MVDLYWKCYAYGDELKPHIEFLDGIMLSSTRDIAPSCVENVDELIERQEKSLVQLDTKRNVVNELIEKGTKILENPDKPKFLESHVQRIKEGWDLTKSKAQERLKLLNDTKEAWIGYAENSEVIVVEIEKGLEEITKVKKKFNLEQAFEDLAKRQKIYNDTKDSIMGLWNSINHNVEVMNITIHRQLLQQPEGLRHLPEVHGRLEYGCHEGVGGHQELLRQDGSRGPSRKDDGSSGGHRCQGGGDQEERRDRAGPSSPG